MKNKPFLWAAGLMLISSSAQSQQLSCEPCLPLEITTHKTVNVVFPYALAGVERGSADILAQKAPGADNILQLKARKKGFIQSSLSVITAQGKLYCFVVDYADQPMQLTLLVTGQPKTAPGVMLSSSNLALPVDSTASLAALGKKTIRNIRDAKGKAVFRLTGLFTQHDQLYFAVSLRNKAALSYQIGAVRLFLKDRKPAKRTAQQQSEISPKWISGMDNASKHSSAQFLVIATDKFPFSKRQYLTIELSEKNGSRNLRLPISARKLLRARTLPTATDL